MHNGEHFRRLALWQKISISDRRGRHRAEIIRVDNGPEAEVCLVFILIELPIEFGEHNEQELG